MQHTRLIAQKLRANFCFALVELSLIRCGMSPLVAQSPVDVLTYHNDLERTGQNLSERVLTPANVNSNSFGLLFTQPSDGYEYAQPLYMAGVTIPGKGTHNVVFVATMHNGVYAFDADDNQGANAAPLWQVSLIDPGAGITSVPINIFGFSYPPELGITGTPVIDPSTGTLFLVAKIRDASSGSPQYAERLYALDVGTGEVKFGGSVDIEGSAPGTGAGNDGTGHIPFNPYWEFQRSGLLLLNGVVYISFASQGDEGPYHGCIAGYDANTLEQVCLYYTTPDALKGGIWMSGAAPSADGSGNIYCMTGNGTFDADVGGKDFGDSFLKLTPSGNSLTVSDFFTPYNQAELDRLDGDLGSGAPLLLPDSVGSIAHPHLLVGSGKEGVIYLVDRDDMGHYNPINNSQIVQSFSDGAAYLSMAAYFNHWIYYLGINDVLKAYSITNGQMSSVPVSQATVQFGFPGATPSISANGTSNAIAWVIQADAFFSGRGPAVLRAYNATNLPQQLYSSSDAGLRDQLGLAQHLSVPTVANGKVYVGTAFGLSVFGNLGAPVISMQPQSRTVNAGDDVTFKITAGGTPPLSYHWQFKKSDIPNATNAWLTVTNVQVADGGDYRVSVGNSFGGMYSSDAWLFINPSSVPPRLTIDAQLEMTIEGVIGQTYSIQSAARLDQAETDWATLTTLTLTNSVESWTDPEPADQPGRFYRAVVEAH